MPYSPKAAAVNIEIKRSTRNDRPIPYCGTVNEASATMLTTMTMMELTIFASTAAWPMTTPPTNPIVWPSGLGSLKPASLSSSIVISITIASIIGGKGTFSLFAAMVTASDVGSSPW